MIKQSTFFRPNIPKDMRKCTLKLAYSPWPPYIVNMEKRFESGLEGEMIYMIAEKFNIHFQMSKHSYEDGDMLHFIADGNSDERKIRNLNLKVRL